METRKALATAREKKSTTDLKFSLISSISKNNVSDVLGKENPDAALILSSLSGNLNIATAVQAKKMFQVQKDLDRKTCIKILCFVIKNFCDSVPVKEEAKMIQSHHILELAEDLMNTYTHDSIEDFIVAFKIAKKKGRNFYNTLGITDIYAIINDYFEKEKPAYLESVSQTFKEQETTQDLLILSQIAEQDPELASKLKHMISPSDTDASMRQRVAQIIQERKGKGLDTDIYEKYFRRVNTRRENS